MWFTVLIYYLPLIYVKDREMCKTFIWMKIDEIELKKLYAHPSKRNHWSKHIVWNRYAQLTWFVKQVMVREVEDKFPVVFIFFDHVNFEIPLDTYV